MKRVTWFLLFALIACTNANNSNSNRATEETSTNDDFLSFVAMLPEVRLPFNVNCEKCCGHGKLDYENELVKKFQPEGCAIVGLLGKADQHVFLLVTYPGDLRVPSVIVFNADGKIINERNFMTSYCGGDEDFYSSQFLAINKDLIITTYDTVFNLKRDSIKYEVMDTTSIEVDVHNFMINNEGEIVQVDSVMNTAK